MANIDLRQFVDINIISHVSSSVNSTRDTIVLFTNDTTSGTHTGTITLNNVTYNTNLVNSSNYGSIFAGKTTTLAYLSMYFANGGINVLVIEGFAYTDLYTEESTVITGEVLSELDDKYIVVAYAAASEDVETVYAVLKNLATYRAGLSSVYGINEKIILANTSTDNSDSVKNFAVKYSNVLGAEMTIGAYLSKVDVHGFNTVYDYAFTNETILAETVSNSDFSNLMTHNFNVDIELANSVRNCGGNLKNGADLINSYVKIVLHQTLTDSLINLLTQKLKSSTGISKIYTTISEELEKYLTCGYLTTDKVWNDNDLTIVRNGITYTIIEKGTPLVNGYNITVLPISSLTVAERAEHKAPPIYVIIADQYGIRKITINGEVI